MNCAATTNSCGILQVDSNSPKIFLSIASGLDCGCSGACGCGNGLTAENTYTTIRRDGPVLSNSYGGCANPVNQIYNCPILPGQLQYPMPTFIVPCPNPSGVAPIGTINGVAYKYPPFVRYNLFSKSLNELCFYLDGIFFNAPSGRYVADLFIDDEYIDSQKIQYTAKTRIKSFRSQRASFSACADNNPAPECSTPDCA